jgi:hypothetical protein
MLKAVANPLQVAAANEDKMVRYHSGEKAGRKKSHALCEYTYPLQSGIPPQKPGKPSQINA